MYKAHFLVGRNCFSCQNSLFQLIQFFHLHETELISGTHANINVCLLFIKYAFKVFFSHFLITCTYMIFKILSWFQALEIFIMAFSITRNSLKYRGKCWDRPAMVSWVNLQSDVLKQSMRLWAFLFRNVLFVQNGCLLKFVFVTFVHDRTRFHAISI